MPFFIVAILAFAIPVLGYFFFAAFVVALPIALVIALIVIVRTCRSTAPPVKNGAAEQSAKVFVEADRTLNRKHLKENLDWLPPDK